MDAPSRDISRRTCMGMMMSALLGCRGSAPLHAASPPEIAITIDDFDLNASTPLLDPDARSAPLLDTLQAMRVQAAAFVCGQRVDNPVGRRRLALWSGPVTCSPITRIHTGTIPKPTSRDFPPMCCAPKQ